MTAKHMALSLFAHKRSTRHTAQEAFSRAAPLVRTLQDDLKDIASGVQEPAGQREVGENQLRATTVGGGLAPLTINPFSEEGERQLKNQSENPFGVVPGRSHTPVSDSAPSQLPTLTNSLTPLMYSGELLSNQPVGRYTAAWISSVIGTIIILTAVGGGVWYFILSDQETASEPALSAEVTEKSSAMTGSVPSKQAPFASDRANYLSLNTEIVSPEDIRQTLSQTAGRITEADLQGPVEFLITDQNNNPLAFSRFAFLLQFDLDADLLALMEETFSLYAYNDAGRVRFGLSLGFKDTPTATTLITKTEDRLPYALRALILEPQVTVAKKASFRATNYNQHAVRFTNIDSAQNISLDYTVDQSRLFIGLSKDTLRGILDAHAR